MKILILGAGRVGSSLASTLSKENYDVNVVDLNKDKFQVIGFSNSVDINTSFYSDTNLIFQAIDSMKVDSSTAFYDAISVGLDSIQNGINIIVALTDGNDNASSTSVRKVIRKSKKSNTPLILIGLGELDVELLNELANKTNGRFYHAKSTLELKDIYQNIQNQIKSIYDLKYSSESLVFEDSIQQINLSFKIDTANYIKRNIKYNVPEIAYEYLKKKQKKRKTKLLKKGFGGLEKDLIINRKLELKLKELFKGLEVNGTYKLDNKVYLGGPVSPGAIFILHSPEKSWKDTLKVSDEIFMTTSPDAIKDIAKGEGPQDFIITLGYTGWGPGQLNDEISENAWLTYPEDYSLIFKTNPEDQINEISKKVGYDIRMISPDFGNA